MITGLLTEQEAANYLNFSVYQLRKLRKSGHIGYSEIPDSHFIRYDQKDLDEFRERTRIPVGGGAVTVTTRRPRKGRK